MRLIVVLVAILICAEASAGPIVLAQAEGGGIGGSLTPPETRIAPIKPHPRGAIYSFPINTAPDGWAALKAEPSGIAPRLAKVYDGTPFLVVGAVPGWKHVQLQSGASGWIVERLVGCCRPAAQ